MRLTSNDAKSVGLRAASGDTHGVPIATSGERSGAIKKRYRIIGFWRLADLDLSLVDRRVVSRIRQRIISRMQSDLTGTKGRRENLKLYPNEPRRCQSSRVKSMPMVIYQGSADYEV